MDGEVLTHHSAKKMIGYVMQDDVIHSNLTVKEAIYYAAMVMRETGRGREEVKKRGGDVRHSVTS